MAETTIQWADYTFNPWVGCQRVSPGCTNCYAENYDKRVGGVPPKRREHEAQRNGLPVPAEGEPLLRWGPKAPRTRTSVSYWKQPLKWDRVSEVLSKAGKPRLRVFCASLADVFEDREDLTPWRHDLFGLIAATPYLDWMLLTKRPENIKRLMPSATERPEGVVFESSRGLVWSNVWLGTTVEDQQRANERIPHLLAAPAVVRFLSCEPLLEEVNIIEAHAGQACAIDWVIVGGESGGGARPFEVEWARFLVEQARLGKAAPFVKQLGSNPTARYYDEGYRELHEAEGIEHPDPIGWSYRDGQPPLETRMSVRGRDSHGGDPAEWPLDLRVREFPKAVA